MSTHVENICRQLRLINEVDIERFRIGIQEEWIESIHFYGVERNITIGDFQGISNVRLSIHTGWDKVDKKKVISALKQQELRVSEETSQFNAFVNRMGLRVEWTVRTTEHVDADPILLDQVHRTLNLCECLPFRGRKVTQGIYGKSDPLIPSFSYELNFEEPGDS